MATNILMPALSPTMTEGTLARWLKKEGDTVKSGDILAEIETDKATMEFEAVDEGVLGKILVPDGSEGVKVNAPIGIMIEEGEAVPSGAPAANGKGGEGNTSPSGSPALEAVKEAGGKVAGAAEQPVPAPQPKGEAAPAASAGGGSNGRVFASPLARRMAEQAGIDLGAVQGSGPNGRIVKADIEAAQKKGGVQGGAAAKPAAAAQPAAAPAAAPQAEAPKPAPKAPAITAPHKAIPNSSMRKVIARRLSESKQTVPHFYVSMDIQLDALLKLRADLNARAPKDGPGAFKLSVNDLVIKAAAATLRKFPNVNATWTDDAIIQYDDVDISVAVSIPEGLITPIVRKADQKGLATISNEMKDLAARAKSGKLKPEEFQGGGFSISNMGMFGVKDFAAIINPPQAGILAVSSGEQRPVVKDGALAVATVMTCTLSVDHRVVDGALAAEWLASFKKTVEDPLSLML
ncbi:Dihydrolipoamide acetyltransferase component of pyruvate dehydrogenase complex [Roseomonas mucosa]|uniref:pyruvate dehydrogenase complex dihydrolipoamide acetyltransferase n=1 Tax=Roseomonas TaxID=125216 RepID=UPI000965DA60|nr:MULTISPECIES: pyruvate dehydrogenase complex dihydrolipoamide acetyltransferase [Roseomonas]ATR20325.1 pyruvate dehydrogenase complex dihydrolipoamide acetyltransferase [Roseomonas sp. FDAARGOS_362]MDT8263249.1 pyruvate dehydrogenase complex dihydrolipoamide acetyltransferase [Roseomonas sp. DSM 102946]UZO97455.1 Dihydrolipoamide acetyltransferase component of pyruvate dehydrogenase complex [Roseomonas mucosa]GAV35660.1 dihydrolipoyllysine-residue acetyltransferase component of pyruvate dehy